MMGEYILNTKDIIIALDEGTTNVKAIAVDKVGNIVSKHSHPLSIKTPQNGWVEQSGIDLIQYSIEVISKVIADVGPERVLCIGISNQRETVIGWNKKTHQPISPAITWQCSRGVDICERLKMEGHGNTIQKISGLPLSTMFSSSKIKWIIDSYGEKDKSDICVGTIDSWLLWNFTDGESFYCDISNASRTQLLDIKQGVWSQELCDLFGIDINYLPTIKPSSAFFGETKNLKDIPDGIPILSMIGDSHAALFGHCIGETGIVKATYGTGSSVMSALLNVNDVFDRSIAISIGWHDGEHKFYGLEGNILHTGDALSWMLDILGVQNNSKEYLDLLNEAENKTDSNLGVYFVPALTGLSSPWWIPNARGIIKGLSRGVNRTHLVRAALESIAYQIFDVVDMMKKNPNFELKSICVDGGPTKNNWLMQFQSDLLGCPVLRSKQEEMSAIGASLLARKQAYHLSNKDLKKYIVLYDQFVPNPDRHNELQKCITQWRHAVMQTQE